MTDYDSEPIFLYHGTKRADDFEFPRFDKKVNFTQAPFSWFTTDYAMACKYANLATGHGRPRVLSYYLKTENPLKTMDTRGKEKEYGEQVFGEKAYHKFYGKHSSVYRIAAGKTDSMMDHYYWLTANGYNVLLETGVDKKSTDWVFVESRDKKFGAHHHLGYLSTTLI